MPYGDLTLDRFRYDLFRHTLFAQVVGDSLAFFLDRTFAEQQFADMVAGIGDPLFPVG